MSIQISHVPVKVVTLLEQKGQSTYNSKDIFQNVEGQVDQKHPEVPPQDISSIHYIKWIN